MIPTQKIEVGTTEIQSDCLTSIVWRIENAVSRAKIVANDNEGKNFINNIDALDTLKISYRYGSGSYTKVFEGVIQDPSPTLTESGKLVSALAYGYGQALLKTHCSVNFGRESENSTLNTPETIWDDIVDNRVNLNFDGGATGYTLTKTKIKAITTPTINFVKGGYRNNFDILNQVCIAYQAEQAGSAGVHWFVDPSKNLWVDTIAAHTVDTTNWPTWWNTDQAGSTLTEGTDFTDYSFIKQAKEYANKIILFTDWRKPGYDYWTEDSGGAVLWGNDGLTSITNDNTANRFVVGSHSIYLLQNGGAVGVGWLPANALSADAAALQKNVVVTDATAFKAGDVVHLWDNTPVNEDNTIASIAGTTLTMESNLINAYATANNAHCSKSLGWDLTNAGSENSIPTLEFYVYADTDIAVATCYVRMFTTRFNTDYYYTRFLLNNAHRGQFIHKSIPIGPLWHHAHPDRDSTYVWQTGGGAGSGDWTNINGIAFYLYNASPVGNGEMWIDDLHVKGKVTREAYNSTKIAADNEYQKTLKLDVSVDDTLKAADDSGTAAQMAYAELLWRQTIPVIGEVTIKGTESMLPGQLVHIHADYTGSAYRVDDDFRVTQATHMYAPKGFTTTLLLSDDMTNTFTIGPSSALTTLAQVLYVDPEAKNLKSGAVDELVPRLSKDYP